MPQSLLIESPQFAELFREDQCALDVRAPVEFARAHLVGSINMPIMNDDERTQVGTTYRTSGKSAAIELGFSMVDGEVRRQRVEGWSAALSENRVHYVICARGGLRSEIAQQWLQDAGVEVARVSGGYKALRSFLLSSLPESCARVPLLLISGYTGSGKTLLLHDHGLLGYHCLDLEEMANHRGSAFGAKGPQPFQASFENALAQALLQLEAKQPRAVLVESESRSIGRVWLPEPLLTRMAASPTLELVAPIEQRITNVFQEYFLAQLPAGADGQQDSRWLSAIQMLHHSMRTSLNKIQRRLGGELSKTLGELLEFGMAELAERGESDTLRQWIRLILERYYDPLYQWQFSQSERPILFRGDREEILQFLRSGAAEEALSGMRE